MSNTTRSSVGHRRGRRLVDQAAARETVDRKGGGNWVRFALGKGMSEHVAGTRRRLKAAGPPATVDVKARDRRQPDDGRAVGRYVDDAAPIAQHPQPRELREQLAD